MADAMDTLKGILGDDAEDKIKSVLGSISDSGGRELPDTGNIEYLMQMKDLLNKITSGRDDPRSRLLLSLRPYMSEGRKKSIDSAVRLLGLTKLAELFNGQRR